LRHYVTDWSRDGRFLLYHTENAPKTGYAVWILPLERNRKPVLLLGDIFNEWAGVFSPDGRWIAYASTENKPVAPISLSARSKVRNCQRAWAGGPTGEILATRLCQRDKCFERIVVARDPLAGAALDISDGSKTIHFGLEDPVRMLEWPVEAGQRHRSDVGERAHATLF
jgi:hypothetical protein